MTPEDTPEPPTNEPFPEHQAPAVWQAVRSTTDGVATVKVQQQIAALPRYRHCLLPQSLVASQMVEHADGDWIRRADVLKLL